MLTIKTEIKESQGKGVGVFSLENIWKGKIIWEEHPLFYKIIPYYEFERLPIIQQDFIRKYATEYPDESMFYFDLDNTRFMNHSTTPNIEWRGSVGIAIEHIKIGDEIMCDYVKLNPKNIGLDFIRKAGGKN